MMKPRCAEHDVALSRYSVERGYYTYFTDYCHICKIEERANKPKRPLVTLESLELRVKRYIKLHNLHNPENKMRYRINEEYNRTISIRCNSGAKVCHIQGLDDLQNAFARFKYAFREATKPKVDTRPQDEKWMDKWNKLKSSSDKSILPKDSAERKTYPIFTGALQYFPRAIASVANQSYKGNQKHHPDKPLHWDKPKSNDHSDCLIRHLVDSFDPTCDKKEELTAVAWRALALLETYLEKNDEQ